METDAHAARLDAKAVLRIQEQEKFGASMHRIHRTVRNLLRALEAHDWRKVEGKLPTGREAGSPLLLVINNEKNLTLLVFYDIENTGHGEWLGSENQQVEPSEFEWWKPLSLPTEES